MYTINFHFSLRNLFTIFSHPYDVAHNILNLKHVFGSKNNQVYEKNTHVH